MWIATLAASVTFLVASQSGQRPELIAETEPERSPVSVSASRQVQRAAFFDAEVVPQIEKTNQLNREAADRCIVRLQEVFRGYQSGVKPFVEDLTSISTRLGIVRRMPSDWWRDDGQIEIYVRDKFESYLFSQQQLIDDIASVLDRFRDEVDANQKTLLVSVQASLDMADLPEVHVDQYEPFFASVVERLRGYSAEQGTNSVYNALTVLFISEAGSYAAVTIIAGLLSRFGTAAAVSAATGAGATAGATAAGAGGGSLAGPVGTAVGLGIGLAVGLVVDWWMTDRFEDEMTKQMSGYLKSLEQTILNGNSDGRLVSAEGESAQTGLSDALPALCGGLEASYRDRFFEQIVIGDFE